MATQTSRLIVSLIDGVTAPARAASRGILGIPRAVKQANGQMTTVTQRLDQAMARNTEALDRARGRMVDAVAGFYLLNQAIGGPVRAAMAFEEAMADVRKVVDFPTPRAFKDFQQGLIEISKTVPMSVDGLAQIAAAAGQAGIARDDILKFTEAAAKVGTAFDISADQAGDAMAKLMTGLGLSLDEAVLLTDAMNHLSNSQASSAAEILDVVRRVGAQGQMFGFTAEQTAAFASAMISAGAESEVAATSFRNMGKALTIGDAATKRQKDAFKELGMDATKVAKAMQKDAVGTTILVLEALAKIPKEQQAAVASQLFGDEARALGPLLTQLDLVRASVGLVGEEGQYAGSSFREFEARSKTLAAAMQRFRNRLSAVGITIGNALIPMLDQMLERLTPFLEWVSDFVSKHSEMVAAIVAITAGFVGLRIALATLSYLALMGRGGVLGALAVGARALGGTVGYLWGAAKATIALQAALGAMAGGQTLGVLGRIAAGARGMLFAVPGVSMIASALTAIGTAIAGISMPIWGAFAVVAAAVAAAGYTIYRYWDRITAVMSGVGQALGEIMAPALEKVRPLLDWLAPLGDAIAAGWNKAKEALASVGEWLGSFFEREVLNEEDKAAAKQAGYDFIMAIWDGMKQVASDFLAWVSGIADKMIAPFKDAANTVRSFFGSGSATASDSVGSYSEFGDTINGQRAKGGPMSAGGTYLVGEDGPEVVTPSRSGYVNPNGSGGAGPQQISFAPQIIFHGTPQKTAAEIADEVVARLDRKASSLFNGVYADTGLRPSD